jgi:hypothetical protein
MTLNSSATATRDFAGRSALRRGLPVKLVVERSGELRVFGHEPALDIEQCLTFVITEHAHPLGSQARRHSRTQRQKSPHQARGAEHEVASSYAAPFGRLSHRPSPANFHWINLPISGKDRHNG